MALSIPPVPDPAFPTDPVTSPHTSGHPHLACDTCDDSAPTPAAPPAAGAASGVCRIAEPAATCGMPDRSLPLPGQSSQAWRRARDEHHPLPLPDRCWDLFCQGHSYAAIARTLGIYRETAARHVRTIHQQVQADRRADRALALSRALATQQRLQATAWDLLAIAQAQAPTAQATISPPRAPEATAGEAPSSPPRARGGVGGEAPASLADCARLLNLILAAAREAARLERLYDRDAPARQADQDDAQKTVHLIIERIGDPDDDDPLHPADDPTADMPPLSPTSSPPADGSADASRLTPALAPADPAGDPTAPASGLPAASTSASVPRPPTSSSGVRAEAFSAARAIPPSPAPAAIPSASPPPVTLVSLGDGSSVWAVSSPRPAGEGLGVRSSRRRRVPFAPPGSTFYSLG
jgi:hypothetical protein